MGTWTGKLNNKVGSFKFIYVNLLPDETPPARRRRCNSKTHRAKSKPKTLEEVLDSMGLTVSRAGYTELATLDDGRTAEIHLNVHVVFQELSSLLSMHGFQSLEDFSGLKESHLNELNITDPEQRSKILNATELLIDCTFTHCEAALLLCTLKNTSTVSEYSCLRSYRAVIRFSCRSPHSVYSWYHLLRGNITPPDHQT